MNKPSDSYIKCECVFVVPKEDGLERTYIWCWDCNDLHIHRVSIPLDEGRLKKWSVIIVKQRMGILKRGKTFGSVENVVLKL